MKNIKFRCDEKDEYTIISFELGEVIAPDIFPHMNLPKVDATKGVILSGRGPIWLYGYLIHQYHPTKFIATYDPRLGGAVVVESHTSKYKIGDLIKVVNTQDVWQTI